MTKDQLPRRLKVGVLGCGNMGQALSRGLVEHSFYPQNISVFDTDPKRTAELRREINVRVAKSSRQIASVADLVVLAVKPQVMESVLHEIGLCTPRTTAVLSVAAGIRIAQIQKAFKEKVGVIRVMPNMPALVGEGMSAYCLGPYATGHHRKLAETVLRSIGEVVEVKEGAMDLVTAISGSGPAYFFLLVEKMIEAACEMGMKADVAKKLVYQTALGSAKALIATREDPEVLIGRVASKGGTTEAALRLFRQKGFGKIVADAIGSAERRSKELSGS
jgi:pyrroline-5-carboxylate reductase